MLEALLGGVGGMVGGITSAIASMRNTDKTNQANKDVALENLGFQREVQDYQKALQQQIFEREDTAHQREIQDLRAAGINPLATAGGNGANAGSVVPLTELNNNYQAQSTDFSGLQAAGAALDAGIQNERVLEESRQAREDQKRENMYARTQQHAEFTQELEQRQNEAATNYIKAMADIAAHTEDNKLKEKLENAANALSWAQLKEIQRQYDDNASSRAEAEKGQKIQNERNAHDLEIDKKAGTKSSETQDTKVTTGQRIISAVSEKTQNKNIKNQLSSLVKTLSKDDALTMKYYATGELKGLKGKELEKKYDQIIKTLQKAGRSKNLINTMKELKKYGAVPIY